MGDAWFIQGTRAGRRPRAIASSLVALLLVAAALGATLTATGVTWASDLLGAVLPVDPSGADPFDLVAAAVALVALAAGIARGKRLAWVLGVAILAAGGLAQLLTLRHPIGAALAAVCLLGLLADRLRYRARTPKPWRRRLVAIVVVGAFLVAVESVLLDPTPPNDPGGPASDLEELLGNVGAWLAFDSPLDIQPSDVGLPLEVLDLAARLAIVSATLAMLRAMPSRGTDPTAAPRVRAIARRFGRGALLPFQLGADKFQFTVPGTRGLVVYGQAGRTAVVLGDPIGPPADAWAAFAAFVESCRDDDVVPAVYQASASARGRLAALDFRTIRIGEEAVIDLRAFSLDGPRRANLRHTVTRARRGGVSIEWHPDGLGARIPPELMAELVAIDRAWRARVGPELGFTVGRFEPAEATGIALAVARERDGTMAAFATFRPTGADHGFVLDLMRRRSGGTPGALEMAIAEAALRMSERGVRSLSLGLAPLAGLERPGSTGEERVLARIGGAIRPVYDIAGLVRFKAKFDPRWDARYVAFLRRSDLVGLCVALLRLHLRPARPLSPTGSLGGPERDPGSNERPRGRRRGRPLRSRPAGQR